MSLNINILVIRDANYFDFCFIDIYFDNSYLYQ